MMHTRLYKNEAYLILLSVISIGVLSGHKYFDLALIILLFISTISLSDKTIQIMKRNNNKQ